jgi:hypothetical protein
MKAIDSQTFNREYPEQFTWGHLESPKLSSVANSIRGHIEHDLRTADRNYTPGLRQALNIIAELADI